MFFFVEIYSQSLHRSSIGASGCVKKSNTFIVSQSIGQQSVSGVYNTRKLSVQQGFQQFLYEFNEINNDFVVSFYPNPTSDYLYFSFDRLIKIPFKVEVCDILGRIISVIDFEPSDKNIYTMSFGERASSMYLIKVKIDHKEFYSKIIKK
jgi:hypothetical protein